MIKYLGILGIALLTFPTYSDTSITDISDGSSVVVNGIKIPLSLYVVNCLKTPEENMLKNSHKVRIVFENSRSQVHLTAMDDYYIEENKGGSVKTLHREQGETAYFISKFESEYISIVCKILVPVLEHFEKSLQNRKWEQCRRFDTFLYKFIRGFYYAINVSRNIDDSKFQKNYLPDSLFETAFDEEKMAFRNQMWQQNNGYVEKLSIVTNDLLNQIKVWLQPNYQKENAASETVIFSNALSSFIKIYYDTKSL